MKKILLKSMLTSFLFFTALQAAFATTIEVEAITPFSTKNPAKTIEIMTKERTEFENGIVWEAGTIVEGQILDVKKPKRGKRDASFKFFPLKYTYENKSKTNTEDTFIGKYTKTGHLDKGKLAVSAATTAGGMIFHIPFLSQGVSLVKGAVQNPENNRLKSGVVQVYKDSPVSYIEEGKDIVLQKGDIFYLKFIDNDTEDYPNKSHMLEVEFSETSSAPNSENGHEHTFTIHTVNPEDVLHEIEEELR